MQEQDDEARRPRGLNSSSGLDWIGGGGTSSAYSTLRTPSLHCCPVRLSSLLPVASGVSLCAACALRSGEQCKQRPAGGRGRRRTTGERARGGSGWFFVPGRPRASITCACMWTRSPRGGTAIHASIKITVRVPGHDRPLAVSRASSRT